jgi:hypothetical protein
VRAEGETESSQSNKKNGSLPHMEEYYYKISS